MLTAEKKKYTKEDYLALDEGEPFQLINADLVMSPGTNQLSSDFNSPAL